MNPSLMSLILSGLLLIAIADPAWTAPGQVQIGPPADWVTTDTLNLEYAIPTQQVSNGLYYLLLDRQTDLTGPEASTYVRIATHVLDGTGAESMTRISADFDPQYQQLIWHWMDIYRDGQRLGRLSHEQLQLIQREENLDRNLLDGHLSSFAIINDLRPGDVLDFAYTVTGRNPVLGGQFATLQQTRFTAPVGRLHSLVRVPESESLNSRNATVAWFDGQQETPLGRPVPLIESTEQGVRTYRIDARNLDAQVTDSQMPWDYPTEFVWQLSSFDDWRAVRLWAQVLFEESLTATENSVAARLRSTERYSQKNQQITDLIRWVQNDVRYLGMEIGSGSYRPRLPDAVLDSRFGDCKDKSALLVNLLQQLGVDADVALVHSRNGASLINTLPSHLAFDHAIVRIRHEGRTHWIDPTLNLQGGVFPMIESVDYGHALVLEDGVDALESMAREAPSAPTETIHVNYRVDPLDQRTATMVIQTTLEREAADRYRRFLSYDSHDQIQANYLEYYQGMHPNLSLAKVFTVDDHKDVNVIVVSEAYRIADFWRNTDPANMRAEVFALDTFERLDDVSDQTRRYPYAIEHPRYFEHTIHVELPDRWPSSLDQQDVTHPAFEFSSRIRLTGHELTMRYLYRTLDESVSAAEFSDYVEKMTQAISLTSYILTSGDPTASNLVVLATYLMDGRINRELMIVLVLSYVIALVVGRWLYRRDPSPKSLHIASRLQGLRGWAIVLILWLILQTVLFLMNSYTWVVLFDAENWMTLGTEVSGMMGISGQLIVMLEIFFSSLQSVLFGVSLWLLLARRSAFAQTITVAIGISLVWLWGFHLICLELPLLADLITLPELIGASFGTLVVLMYSHVSVRITQTCVRRRRRADRSADTPSASPSETGVV